MKPAGRFVGEILKELKAMTKVGTNLLEIDEYVHKKIVDRKGAESCYVDYAPDFGTGPFAHYICTSVNNALPRDSPNLYPTHPNGNRLPGLLCPKRRGGRQKRKKPPGVKPGRTMGPDVTCIMSWRRRNMSFIPMIPVLTSIKPGCLLPLPEYASAMNVSPCASSSTSTRYTPIRRTAACLREKHRLRLS